MQHPERPRKPAPEQPGPRAHVRNRRGRLNRPTLDLKHGITEAAVRHGFDGKGKDGLVGDCQFLAAKHPKAFAGLLRKVLPLNVNENTDFVGGALTINIMPVQPGHFLDADNNITAMPLIECEPLEVSEPVHVAMPEPEQLEPERQDEPVAPGVVLWPKPK